MNLFYLIQTYVLIPFLGWGTNQDHPPHTVNLGRPPMENPDLFGGDMVVELSGGYYISKAPKLWKNRTVPFVYEPSFSALIREFMLTSMEDFHRKTCVRFVPRSIEREYIKFIEGDGCFSHVGMAEIGEQEVSIGGGSPNVGTITHELCHALGLFHENERSDRDDYVTIHEENIAEGMEKQFVKVPFKAPGFFDIKSIMMPDNTTFSKDGHSMTILANSGEPLTAVAEKEGLSDGDASKINEMYDC